MSVRTKSTRLPPPPAPRESRPPLESRSLPLPPRSNRSLNFRGSQENIRVTLGLSKAEFQSLLRALRDSESEKPKTSAQHDEDEGWLDWAMRQAKEYGPAIAQLVKTVAAAA